MHSIARTAAPLQSTETACVRSVSASVGKYFGNKKKNCLNVAFQAKQYAIAEN